MTNKKLLQLKKRYIKEGYKKALTERSLADEYVEDFEQERDWLLNDFSHNLDRLVNAYREFDNYFIQLEKLEDSGAKRNKQNELKGKIMLQKYEIMNYLHEAYVNLYYN